jgi:hypothetical protein
VVALLTAGYGFSAKKPSPGVYNILASVSVFCALAFTVEWE